MYIPVYPSNKIVGGYSNVKEWEGYFCKLALKYEGIFDIMNFKVFSNNENALQ